MPIHTTDNAWILETQQTAYALGLNAAGMLTHRYWGAKLPRLEDYPAPMDSEGFSSFNGSGQLVPYEYPAYAGASYVDPCLKLSFSDGVRDAVLEFERSEVIGSELHIHLRDAYYPLRLTLHYRIHEGFDLLERFVTIQNTGSDLIQLERIFSAQWHFPRYENYRLSQLSGHWYNETQLQREWLQPGIKTLESRRLTTSHQFNPWFAIDTGNSSETSGEVWFGVLAWSGNWKLNAEVTEFGSTRINFGLNDWDFTLPLPANSSYTTPSSLAGFSSTGFGGASRVLHSFVRETVLPHGEVLHKVLYNSWEATYFNVDEKSQSELAIIAADLGVELFVMDDGWFHGRGSDNAGLGDWWADETKFPNGITPLIETVNALGMEFGLWLEPEMVNPDSDLYRKHPDWVIHFPTRKRTLMRDQLILNLARTDVQDYLITLIDNLLSSHNITFIKWDMNRNVSEPGGLEGAEARAIWVRYVEGLYRVWETLRGAHPNVVWQSCSGGGGRADLGILRFADQIWVSDNTMSLSRLKIQEGFSQIFPAITMEAWVTDSDPKYLPLEFAFHVSMAGTLGVGANLLHWDETQRQTAKRLIEQYKDIRQIVQFGHQYRLRSAFTGAFSSLMYVAKDQSEAVLFAFRTHLPEPVTLPTIKLQGLEPQSLYEVEGVTGARSGAAWMHIGLDLQLQDFRSAVFKIRRVQT
jgi:alpha-galactosidase